MAVTEGQNKDYGKNRHAIIGGGEMGDRIRAFDWSTTALGKIENWPKNLLSAVNMVLQSPAPFLIMWGADGIAIYNDAYAQFAGNKPPGLLGASCSEKWPEASDFIQNIVVHCLQGKSLSYKSHPFTVFRNNHPEEIYMDLFCSPISDDEGKWAGALALNIETTDAVKSVEAMQKSEEQLSSIFNQTTVGIAETDLSGKFVLVNHRFCEMVGRTAQELYRLKMQDISHKEDLPPNLTLFKAAVAEGKPFTIEKRYVRPDNAHVWVRNDVTQVKDTQGNPKFILAISYDITEQKKAEREQQLFRALCENSSDFIGIATTEGKPFYINPAGRKMLGIGKEDNIQNISFLDHFIEEDHAFVNEVILPEQWRTGRWIGEFRFRNIKTGQVIPVHYNQFVIKNPETAEVMAIATVSPDITQRKQTEEALKRQNEELQKTNKDLDNFIYTASHDLKAPIINIEGLLDALISGLPAGCLQQHETESIIHMIRGSIGRFRKTIADLTDLSKLQRNASEDISQNLVHFDEVFEEVCLDLQTFISSSSASIKTDFSQCTGIRFSRKNMRSILYNLVSNALKYRSPDRDPVISINSASEDGYCVLSVQDNGLGIDLSQESKIFSMFRRLHTHVEGTGVGLYIVKKIVEDSGGRIEVKSEVGKGSTFNIFFRL